MTFIHTRPASTSCTLLPYADLFDTYLEFLPGHNARIKGTDLTAQEARERIFNGEGIQVLKAAYPELDGDALKVAVVYASEHSLAKAR